MRGRLRDALIYCVFYEFRALCVLGLLLFSSFSLMVLFFPFIVLDFLENYDSSMHPIYMYP